MSRHGVILTPDQSDGDLAVIKHFVPVILVRPLLIQIVISAYEDVRAALVIEDGCQFGYLRLVEGRRVVRLPIEFGQLLSKNEFLVVSVDQRILEIGLELVYLCQLQVHTSIQNEKAPYCIGLFLFLVGIQESHADRVTFTVCQQAELFQLEYIGHEFVEDVCLLKNRVEPGHIIDLVRESVADIVRRAHIVVFVQEGSQVLEIVT